MSAIFECMDKQEPFLPLSEKGSGQIQRNHGYP